MNSLTPSPSKSSAKTDVPRLSVFPGAVSTKRFSTLPSAPENNTTLPASDTPLTSSSATPTSRSDVPSPLISATPATLRPKWSLERLAVSVNLRTTAPVTGLKISTEPTSVP